MEKGRIRDPQPGLSLEIGVDLAAIAPYFGVSRLRYFTDKAYPGAQIGVFANVSGSAPVNR